MPSEPPPPFSYGSRPAARTERRRAYTRPARGLGWSGAALALLGLASGVTPLLACGGGLICLRLLVSAWALAGIRGLQASRHITEHRVVEGEPLELTLELRGWQARFVGAVIEDPLSGQRISAADGGWQRTEPAVMQRRIAAAAPRRGRHILHPPTLIVSDPFGLSRAASTSSFADDELLVVPRAEPVEWTMRGWRAAGGDQQAGNAIFGAGEVDGVREYQPGTPATRIYWHSLAGGRELQERRLIGAAQTRPTVILDCRGEGTDQGLAQLDAAVRAVASLALALSGRGGCLVQIPGSRAPLLVTRDLRSFEAVRTALGQVELQWREQAPPSLRPDALHGAVLYVSSEPVSLPRVLVKSRHPVLHVLPLSSTPHDTGRVLQVAGCGGYLLRQRVSAGRAA